MFELTKKADTASVFFQKLSQTQGAVILTESRRNIPTADADRLFECGKWLAEKLPKVLFRSGNAEGSDTAFARGTGHTIRVCRLTDVPVITQEVFLKFMLEG
ncbi:MAG: hypothetical protein ACOC6C_04030 [Verrucomicrobiota bacterium]